MDTEEPEGGETGGEENWTDQPDPEQPSAEPDTGAVAPDIE